MQLTGGKIVAVNNVFSIFRARALFFGDILCPVSVIHVFADGPDQTLTAVSTWWVDLLIICPRCVGLNWDECLYYNQFLRYTTDFSIRIHLKFRSIVILAIIIRLKQFSSVVEDHAKP